MEWSKAGSGVTAPALVVGVEHRFLRCVAPEGTEDAGRVDPIVVAYVEPAGAAAVEKQLDGSVRVAALLPEPFLVHLETAGEMACSVALKGVGAPPFPSGFPTDPVPGAEFQVSTPVTEGD